MTYDFWNSWEFLGILISYSESWRFVFLGIWKHSHGAQAVVQASWSCLHPLDRCLCAQTIQLTWWPSPACRTAMSRLRRPSRQYLRSFTEWTSALPLVSTSKEHVIREKIGSRKLGDPARGRLESDGCWRLDMAFGRALVFIQRIRGVNCISFIRK